MIVPYYRSSVLLRAIAAVLDLQFQCTATALSFLHKFHSMAPAGTRDQNMIAASCLFCAAKVEEASIRTSDLLNVLVVLSQTPNDLNPQQVFNNLPNAENHSQQLQLLVGDAYYKAKGALLSAEQIVLRFIRFKVVTDQPHKYALKMCNSLGTTQSLVRFSIRLLNDCMVYTNIVLYVKPELLACGSVYSASIMLKEPLSAKEWWRAFNVELGEVEDVGHRLVDMMVEILAKGKESLGNL